MTAAAAHALDTSLASRAERGDQQAFAQLVARHQAPLRAFLRRHAEPADLADDLAQEAFVRAWSRLGQWSGTGTFRGWLFAIAVRCAHDARRAGRRAAARDRHWHDLSDADSGDGEAAAAARLDLDRVLAGLSPDQRAVMLLCHGAGLSHGEVAQALGLPLGTVKSHAARGRERALETLAGRTAPAQIIPDGARHARTA